MATLSFQEAAAQVTAPGERFETTTIEIDGVEQTIFKNAPQNLRQVFDTVAVDRLVRRERCIWRGRSALQPG